MEPRIKTKAPATLSNLNCGFDVLGMAIGLTNDEIIGRLSTTPGVQLILKGPHARDTPADPEKNTAGVAVLKYLEYIGAGQTGVELEVHKKLRPGSGLGSSASSACAAVVLANALFKNPLAKQDLLPFAVLGEYAADQAFHADNVAPCLLGGVILIRDLERLDLQRVYVPKGLYTVAVFPEIRILTSEARGVLRKEITMQQMIRQSANLGSFLLGMERSNMDLLRRSMEDCIVEPQRAHLIAGFYQVKEAAYRAGALSCGISGAGPTMFAMTNSLGTAQQCATAMQAAFQALNIQSESHVTEIDQRGTVIC